MAKKPSSGRWEECPFTGEWGFHRDSFYVATLRKIGSFGQFLLDWKLGVDLGHGIAISAKNAWRWWGLHGKEAE